MATQPTLINSVTRALHLLDAVGVAASPQPAKKLARATGIPLPTTYHLLRTLVHEGYLRRTSEGYVLGERVDVLGRGAQTRYVRQILRRLHDNLHAAAYLALLDDGEIRLTEIVDSPGAPRTDLWVGFHDAAHATALGKAVLAALPEESRRDYVATHPLVDLTPHTVTSPRVLMEEVARTRELAVDHEEYALGVMCAAVVVPGEPQAVAVSVPAGRAHEVLAQACELRRSARLIALARA